MIVRKNLPFNNVAATGVASLELELGMTYQAILLVLGGTTFTHAMVTDIKCKLNGKVFYQINGTRLDAITDYKGRSTGTTYLMIDFSEPAAKTLGGMYGGGIGTAQNVDSFTIEVTITGATAPTLDSYSLLVEPKPLGLIHALVHHPVSFSAGGKFPVILPYGAKAKHLIKRVYFFHTNLTSLEVKKNGLVIFDNITTAINTYFEQYFEGGKTAQTGLEVYDPCMTGDFKRVIDTANAQTLQFNVTVSGSDTVDVYAEYITRLPML